MSSKAIQAAIAKRQNAKSAGTASVAQVKQATATTSADVATVSVQDIEKSVEQATVEEVQETYEQIRREEEASATDSAIAQADTENDHASEISTLCDKSTSIREKKKHKRRNLNCFTGRAGKYFHLTRPEDFKNLCNVTNVKVKALASATALVNSIALENLSSDLLSKSQTASSGRVGKVYSRLSTSNRGRVYAGIVPCVHIFTELPDHVREGDIYIPTEVWDEGCNTLRQMDENLEAYMAQLKSQDAGQNGAQESDDEDAHDWEAEVIQVGGHANATL